MHFSMQIVCHMLCYDMAACLSEAFEEFIYENVIDEHEERRKKRVSEAAIPKNHTKMYHVIPSPSRWCHAEI